MKILIDQQSPMPIYQQIVQAIKLEILSGRLQPNQQLPPIRDLAQLLKINPNTVARSYSILIEEGFLESRAGSGNWVRKVPPKNDALRLNLAEDAFQEFLQKAINLGLTAVEIKEIIARKLP